MKLPKNQRTLFQMGFKHVQSKHKAQKRNRPQTKNNKTRKKLSDLQNGNTLTQMYQNKYEI